MKTWIKRLLERSPYEIRKRASANRFQAIEKTLQSLADRGCSPRLVVDGGANLGHFSEFCARLFPQATILAVEPQPGCRESLAALGTQFAGRIVPCHVALGSPGQSGSSLLMAMDETQTGTGAHIVDRQAAGAVSVPCLTVDELIAARREPADGLLIKLDLQGFEMEALRGAARTLQYADVVLTEVSFYAQAYEPTIAALVAFLDEAGFALYDVASIFARRRDDRPRQGDFVFVRRDSRLAEDRAWA